MLCLFILALGPGRAAAQGAAHPPPAQRPPLSIGAHDWLHALIGADPRTIAWWQMTVRGILVFAFAVVLVHLGRRGFQRASTIDIILSVLIGSNLSRAFTGNASFVPTLVATSVMVILYLAIIHLAAASPRLSRLVKGRAQRIVHRGRPDRRVMRRNGIADDDLREAMRSAGVEALDDIEAAWLERNGSISVLRRRQ